MQRATENSARALLGSWGRTLSGTIVVSLVSLGSTVIIARSLGPTGHGLFAGALLIASLSAALAQLGIGHALVYRMASGAYTNMARRGMLSGLLVASLSAGMAFFGATALFDQRLEGVAGAVSLLAGTSAAYLLTHTLMQYEPSLRAYNGFRVGFAVTVLVGITFVWLLTPVADHTAFILVYAVVTLAALALACALTPRIARNGAKQRGAARPVDGTPSLLRYAAGYHGTIVLGLVVVHADKLILMERASAAEFAFYALAFAATRPIGSIQEAATTAAYARFVGRDTKPGGEAITLVTRLTFLPMLGVALLFASAAAWFVPAVFGASFREAAPAFAILGFEAVCGGASWTLAQRFTTIGRTDLVLARQGISLLPLVVGLWFLPAENAFIALALLVLLASVLRLAVTVMLYPVALKEAAPSLVPRWHDVERACRALRR